jgi:hypothetical protein
VRIRESEDQEAGSWFDIKYEKVPLFCFSCGMLIHQEDRCKNENSEDKQWGEWLRASPGKKKEAAPVQRPSVSSSSFSSRSVEAETDFFPQARVRDLPPRRSLFRDYTMSGSSRTGGRDQRRESEEVRSPEKIRREVENHRKEKDLDYGAPARNTKRGTYVRRARKPVEDGLNKEKASSSPKSKKRRTKQVWRVKEGQEAFDNQEESEGKRQRTASVFDRLEVSPGKGGERVESVFDRLEENIATSADPARQGR